MQPQPPSFDPILTFGMYKDQRRLTQLDEGYLRYLTSPTKEGTDYHHKGLNWAQLARDELKRREGGPPVVAQTLPGRIDVVDMDQYEGSDQGPDPANEPGSATPKSARATTSVEALDGAADLLLREFITREDKNLKLSEWLGDFAKEAASYGVEQEAGNFRYHGVWFQFDLEEGNKNSRPFLRRIAKL